MKPSVFDAGSVPSVVRSTVLKWKDSKSRKKFQVKGNPKNKMNDKTVAISRRRFFNTIGTSAIVVSGLGATALTWDFLSPTVLFEPPLRFRIGKPEEYVPGTVTLDSESKIFIVRDEQGFFSCLSAVCTHLGCLTYWKEDEKRIACPCHGSRFLPNGEVIKAPARRPLLHLLVSLDDRGYLVVDKGEIVDEDHILKV
jgi:cytochrome b6-f complex iron-sulfur subunit